MYYKLTTMDNMNGLHFEDVKQIQTQNIYLED